MADTPDQGMSEEERQAAEWAAAESGGADAARVSGSQPAQHHGSGNHQYGGWPRAWAGERRKCFYARSYPSALPQNV